jgi:saccharopine dehydrogenase (NAD+, L-lysine-forming)
VLCPSDIKVIMASHPEIKFAVQPSNLRIFSDREYLESGATIQ